MSIALAAVPSAQRHSRRQLRALPDLPLRLHHPTEAQFVCGGCGLVLIVGTPTVPPRALAYTVLRCDCGHHSYVPGEMLRKQGAA